MIKDNKHLIHYVPHGINSNNYKPIGKSSIKFLNLKKTILKDKDYKYVVGFVSVNAQRKHPDNLILGFRHFCDKLPEEEAKQCALVLHTNPVAYNDLPVVIKTLCSKYSVIIDNNRWPPNEMYVLYNLFDVYINCSSNEGFGLGVTEAIMCGIPVIATVTGGLQDQMGFVDSNNKPMEFDLKFGTNSTGKYKKHGSWVYPLWPMSRSIHGSPLTPYIMDDIVDYTEIANGLMYWYKKSPREREAAGLEGRRWAMNEGGLNAKNMCNQFIKAMDFTLENFKPNKKFGLYKYNDFYDTTLLPNNEIGFEL